jgi:hypothetical protein
MTNERKPGSEEPEDREPLSATAMFLRSLDGAPPAKVETAGWGTEKDPFGPQTPPGSSAAAHSSSLNASGEFSQIFGNAGRSPTPSTPVAPQPAVAGPTSEEPPGEFTRIFLKETGVPPSRADEILPPRKSEGSRGAKGFSSPGVSDAASGDSTFTNFFKPSPGPASGPPASTAFARQAPFDTGVNAPPRPADATPRFSGSVPPSSDRSVTDILTNLSSDRPPTSVSRNSDVVPYREEPRHVPASSSAPSPASEAGGVTQILNRLAPETVKSVIDSAPVRIESAPATGPGEFTRMISREELNAARAAEPAAPSPAYAAPALGKVQPPPLAAPRMPAAPVLAPAPVAHPAVPPIPAPAVPMAPKPPVLAALPPAPKSKLEAIVPFLLLVNTFLLIVLLVVVVFLIKTR